MTSEETVAIIIKVAIFLLVLTVFFSVILFKYPDVFFRILQRWLIFKSGFSVRSVPVDDNFTFQYIEKGSAEKSTCSLLLIHGFSAEKDTYCDFGKYLPKRMHVIAVDLPGHGGTTRNMDTDYTLPSFVKRIKQFCDVTKLSKRKFHLVGISLGGSVAGLYAKDYGNDLLSLTLMCPGGVKDDELGEYEKEYRTKGKTMAIPQTAEETQKMFDVLMYKKVKIPSYILKGIMKIRSKGDAFWGKVLDHLETTRFLLRDSLEEIRTQTLVLWGEQDVILSVSSLDVLREKIPSCQTRVIEECGHVILFDKPKEAAAIVTEFINKVEKKME